MKRINWKCKIAIVLSIICFIAAVVNLFISKEILRTVIWSGVIIVFVLDYLSILEQYRRSELERGYEAHCSILWCRAAVRAQSIVLNNSNIPEDIQGKILDEMEDEFADTKKLCQARRKELGLGELK